MNSLHLARNCALSLHDASFRSHAALVLGFHEKAGGQAAFADHAGTFNTWKAGVGTSRSGDSRLVVGCLVASRESGSARCEVETHHSSRVGMWASRLSTPNPSQRLKQKSARFPGSHPMTPRAALLRGTWSKPARRMPSA